MITSSREKGFQAKQEGDPNDNKKFPKAPSISRPWPAFRNPRVVRVSRSFGGKDRHSKVFTIRGLRDRRIRLSVTTAIQLYDLQDRLGMSQPSKVIDWLLDATKNDIDKLPPLQLPQGIGHQFHKQMLLSQEPNACQSSLAPLLDMNSAFNKDAGGLHTLGIKINNSSLDGNDHHQESTMEGKSSFWEAEASLRGKSSNEVVDHHRLSITDKGKWIRTTNDHQQQENQDHGFCNYTSGGQVSAQKFFPLTSTPSFPAGLLSNPMIPSYYHWDASNLSLSQFGPHHGFLPQTDQTSLNSNNNNTTSTVSLPSSLTFPSSSQFFFYPPATTMSSLFPQCSPYATTTSTTDSREVNHFQLLTSSSQHILPNSRTISLPMKDFSLNVNQPDKDHDANP